MGRTTGTQKNNIHLEYHHNHLFSFVGYHINYFTNEGYLIHPKQILSCLAFTETLNLLCYRSSSCSVFLLHAIHATLLCLSSLTLFKASALDLLFITLYTSFALIWTAQPPKHSMFLSTDAISQFHMHHLP